MLPSTVYGTAASESLIQAAAAIAQSAAGDGTTNRDTMFTKIFVGGLPYHTSDKTLHEYFEQFGEIEEAVVITDRNTQKSRGYGFVTMKDRPAAERACKDPNPIIDGRKANVNLAYLGAKPRTNGQLAALQTPVQLSQPLTSQLQALFPARLGLPLYYPGLMGAGALLGAHGQQPVLDYATLAAAAAVQQNPAAYGISQQQLKVAGAGQHGIEYGYPSGAYGVLPGAYHHHLQTAQLAAAQQQLNS